MLFFVLSGYVLAHSALFKARNKSRSGALRVIASSTFRRLFRLALPVMFATIFSCTLLLCGAYDNAKDYPSRWISSLTPGRTKDSVIAQLLDALKDCVICSCDCCKILFLMLVCIVIPMDGCRRCLLQYGGMEYGS